jgi:hypothetical protein
LIDYSGFLSLAKTNTVPASLLFILIGMDEGKKLFSLINLVKKSIFLDSFDVLLAHAQDIKACRLPAPARMHAARYL